MAVYNTFMSRVVLWMMAKVVMFSFAALSIVLIKGEIIVYAMRSYVEKSHSFRTGDPSFVTVGNLRFCGVSGSSRFFLGVWITCVSLFRVTMLAVANDNVYHIYRSHLMSRRSRFFC